MKKMKLTKKNKKELKMICGVLIFFAVIFIWIVQNIGLPIKTQVEKGRIKVIDISSYNGTVNWKKVKDHNVNHAMIKIGSGMNEKRAGRKDSKFDTNFRNAGYASIHRGVYYYSYAKTTSDAKKEARHCLKLLKEQGIDPTDLDLPVAFDIEEEAVFQTGRRNVTAVTTTFCDEIKKAGFEPMVYSGASALRNYFEYSKIREYKIWVAHYTKASAPHELAHDDAVGGVVGELEQVAKYQRNGKTDQERCNGSLCHVVCHGNSMISPYNVFTICRPGRMARAERLAPTWMSCAAACKTAPDATEAGMASVRSTFCAARCASVVFTATTLSTT